MPILEIRTKQGYRAALARVDELMNAKFGSPEGEELDALATLVCAYEQEHFPMAAPDLEALAQFRLEQGIVSKG
jgi:HTH-type transcriptional regulator/antitoxin HigA